MVQRVWLATAPVLLSLAILVAWWSPRGAALAVRAECPTRVQVGEEALLRILIGNPHRQPVRLDDIDVAQSFADGVQVLSVTPPPRASQRHRALDVVSLSYDEPLVPGELREWMVRLRAVKPGRFQGELAVYSATNVTSRWLDLTVMR